MEIETQSLAVTQGGRQKILDEAARLFISCGFDGISMREIAEACDLSKATLYYHFKNKEDLFLEILTDSLDELIGMIQTSQAQPGSARERVSAFARSIFIDLPPERRALIRLANQEMNKLSPQLREQFGQRYQKDFIGGITAMLNQGIQSGELRAMDPSLVTWTFMGILYPFFNPEFSRQPAQLETMINAILEVYFDGVTQHAR